MTSLTLSRYDLQHLVGPVLPWAGKDLTLPALTMVRIFTHDDHLYAYATDGRAAALARTKLDHPPINIVMPAQELADLLADRTVLQVELEPFGVRVGVSLTRDDTTLELAELLTIPEAALGNVGPPAGRVLAAVDRGTPGMTAHDMGRVAGSLEHYGPPHQVACDFYTDDRARGHLVAVHCDRFLALIPNANGARTGTSEKARHVGMTAGRGSTFVHPLDVWPTLLQEVPL